ncbi:MAG: FAD/NAD(P)-binding protein [Microbacterium sp.]
MRIAVVGVGAAGLAMSFALTERIGESFNMTLFDPSFQREHRVARGFPYQPDDIEPLLNAPARMMSVKSGDEHHFLRWLDRSRGTSSELNPYVSRPTFGTYLRESFAELRQVWNSRDGVLHCVPEEVLELTGAPGDYTLRTGGAIYFGFDHVILCLGWSAKTSEQPEGHLAAYPLATALEGALAVDHVGIIGTGLTSVDVIRGLLLRGFQGKITAASRRGLLPAARNEAGAIELKLYTRDALRGRDHMSLSESLTLLRAEADLQGVALTVPSSMMRGIHDQSQHVEYLSSGLHDSWSDLFVKLCDESACDTWNLFDVASRRAFRQLLHPYFQVWCNPMPPSTARLLRDAIAAGQLEVRSGLAAVQGRGFAFNDGVRTQTQVVIDASRQASASIASVDTELLTGMRRSGLVVPDAFGGVQVKYGTWEVLSESGNAQNVYAVGSLTQGPRYYVSALDSIVRAVSEVAGAISNRVGNSIRASATISGVL